MALGSCPLCGCFWPLALCITQPHINVRPHYCALCAGASRPGLEFQFGTSRYHQSGMPHHVNSPSCIFTCVHVPSTERPYRCGLQCSQNKSPRDLDLLAKMQHKTTSRCQLCTADKIQHFESTKWLTTAALCP